MLSNVIIAYLGIIALGLVVLYLARLGYQSGKVDAINDELQKAIKRSEKNNAIDTAINSMSADDKRNRLRDSAKNKDN